VEHAWSIAGACSQHPEPNALKNRRNKQEREGFGAAEHSDEVERTPASYAGSHMAFTSVERAQGLTAEKASTAVALARRMARERGGDRRNGAPGGVEQRPDLVMPVGAGRPRPRRRRTTATWPASGGERRARPRARRGGEERAARLIGPKGRRVGPAAPAPFLFFFNFSFLPNIFQAHFD